MEIKSETCYTRNIKCSDVYTESGADYSLPDYLGDVRRVLFTDAVIRPSGKFLGNNEVEFSGVVVYNLVYLDTDNNLSSVEFTSDYDYSVKCSTENYQDAVANTRVSNHAIRLVGPRKISARSSIVGSAKISERDSILVSGSATSSEYYPEINCKSVGVHNTKTSSVVEREYAERVASLEGAIADEVSVVYSSAEVVADNINIEGDSVCVKGKLRVSAVIKNEDQPPFNADKVISFEENIVFDDLDDDIRLIPKLTVTSLKANVNPNEHGCEVVLCAIVEFLALGEHNEQVELLLDAYLKNNPTKNEYREFEYFNLVELASSKGIHNAELDRSELEADEIREIILMKATPKIERTEYEDGVVNIFGEVRYNGVASVVNNNELSYISIKTTSPFITNVNIACQNIENIVIDTDVFVCDASASIDANKVYLSCALESCVSVCQEKKEKILSSFEIKQDENYVPRSATITVYYPCSNDTLFGVAKRFHCSGLKIAKDNNISESVFASSNPDGRLSDIKKLVIY